MLRKPRSFPYITHFDLFNRNFVVTVALPLPEPEPVGSRPGAWVEAASGWLAVISVIASLIYWMGACYTTKPVPKKKIGDEEAQ
ncbi:uncharacterized protein PG986_004202 [Apiospora aurea]|uniref:Uncharacterized protein n=1 Tax=Apiospora aurea TaxID=335848 RepID=A0ABR1QM56_9PEZI